MTRAITAALGAMKCPQCRHRSREGILVYAVATCPVCLLEICPVVAMACGHVTCREDFAALGGVLRDLDTEDTSGGSISTDTAEEILDALDLLCSDDETGSDRR